VQKPDSHCPFQLDFTKPIAIIVRNSLPNDYAALCSISAAVMQHLCSSYAAAPSF